MKHIAALVIFAFIALGAGRAMAQNDEQSATEMALIRDMINQGSASADQFSAAFSDAVPIDQLNATLAKVNQTIGEVKKIEPRGDGYQIVTATHRMDVQINLDGAGKISGLFFKPPVPLAGTLKEAAATLTGFSGDNALLVTRDGETLSSANPDQRLAVGSAFKLGVLAALKKQVAAGTHSWDEVIALRPGDMSLPGGDLRLFPNGSPLTLHTLAGLMISQSDNTATDMLIRVVGRDAVNGELGQFTLTTHELFQLKADAELRAKFLDADMDGKAKIAGELADRGLPSVGDVSTPHNEGVEWYLSASELCGLIADVADLDLFQINPGIASPDDWASIAYKGGSEEGVFNLTSQVKDAAGHSYCVAYTLNSDDPVPEQDVFTAYAALLAALQPQAD